MNMYTSIRRLLLPLIFASLPLFGQTPYTSWDFIVKARNGLFTDSLAHLGVRTDATADYDNQYDVPRPPRSPSGSYLEVYFPHSGGAYPAILGTRYATDYKDPADPTWNMSVEASSAGTVTLTWDSSAVNAVEQRLQLFLYDITAGTHTNMRQHGTYSFSYSVKRDFQIVGSVKINLTCLLEGFWNGASQVPDTVTAYLAASTTPFALVDSAKTFLSSAGTGLLAFPNGEAGSYYVAVRHRNHVEIWSGAPVALTRTTTSFSAYDFSTGAAQAYGTNALKLVGSVYVAWGGDVNQDGVVDFLDRNLTWNNRTMSGYLATDCTGDNVTDTSDDAIVLNNRLIVRQRP